MAFEGLLEPEVSNSRDPFLLDVCIPTFNRAEYLSRLLGQLSSAIAAGDCGQQVRVVVSDNASTDSTPLILEEWRRREPSWELSSRESNVGMMRNFQHLITSSDGEYVWLLGDDDELTSVNGLSELVEKLCRFRPGLLILTGSEVADPRLYDNRNFANARDFVRYFASRDPDFLRRMTWISANVFQRKVFDTEISLDYINGCYSHMYGIFGGLKKQPGAVHLMSGLIVLPAPITGFREKNFPGTTEIRLEWRTYYLFLAREFREPRLRSYASKWSPGIVGYLILFLTRWLRRHDNFWRIWRWVRDLR
jgi:glycosyltransferase involved in cell wall biosynthesis